MAVPSAPVTRILIDSLRPVPLAALVGLLMGASAASAERFSAPPPPKATPSAPPAAPAKPAAGLGDGLADEPLDADALGFRMKVPVGTAVRIDRTPSVNFLLSEGVETPAWRVRVSSITASRADTTARSQCDDYLADLRKREQKFDVLTNEARNIAGKEAHLVFLGVPLEGGARGIMGSLVVPSAPDSYLVFSMVIVDAEFARTRALLDRCFATIELRDLAKAALESNDLLARGAEMLARINPDMLRATVDENPRVYRMWRSDDQGAKKDFGYMVVRVREGLQGEVDASRDPKKFKGEESDRGLLASIDARVVVNDDPTHTVDAQSRYFVRWDRASESWSIRTTERQKRASRSSAQTGLRLAPSSGKPRPSLQVITASRDGMTREPLEWPVPPVYFSQAELIVIGELLPRDAATPTVDFKDYAFDQRDQKLPMRRETWTRIENGWRLETQQGSAPAKIVQEFDNKGKRVRRVDIDGSVTELIALEDLRTLWKAKGLPVD